MKKYSVYYQPRELLDVYGADDTRLGGTCASLSPVSVAGLDERPCIDKGCFWWGGCCHKEPQPTLEKNLSSLHLNTTSLIGGLAVATACFVVGSYSSERAKPLLYMVGMGALAGIGFLSLGGYEKSI